VPIETVIDAVDEVTVFPALSCTRMVGGPEITVPAVAFPGCVEKASLLGGPGITLNEALSPAVRESPLVRVAVKTTPLSALV
jgi:hypothetical protein